MSSVCYCRHRFPNLLMVGSTAASHLLGWGLNSFSALCLCAVCMLSLHCVCAVCMVSHICVCVCVQCACSPCAVYVQYACPPYAMWVSYCSLNTCIWVKLLTVHDCVFVIDRHPRQGVPQPCAACHSLQSSVPKPE